jgi:hypothetical protein
MILFSEIQLLCRVQLHHQLRPDFILLRFLDQLIRRRVCPNLALPFTDRKQEGIDCHSADEQPQQLVGPPVKVLSFIFLQKNLN